MSIDAHDPQDRAEQLLRITQRLNQLVIEEKQALDQGRLDASSQDWAEKEHLARAYRLEMAVIGEDPSRLAGIGQPLKQALGAAVQEFQQALGEHATALTSVKELTEGLVRAVSEEVATGRAPPSAYGASGKLSEKNRANLAQGIAVNAQA